MLREGLLLGARAAVQRAGEDGGIGRQEGLRVKTESGFRELAVEGIPLKTGSAKEDGFLVLFEDAPTLNLKRVWAAAWLTRRLSSIK